MSEAIQGMAELQRRLAAINPKSGLGKALMPALGLDAVREAKLLVPKRTGNLARTIHLGETSPTSAKVVASAKYAAAVEFGTRAHEIVPVRRKVLRWGTGAVRLTGTPTKAAQRGGQVAFSRHVHHPGTRPHPYLVPGAEKAIAGAGIAGIIVKAWNGAG